MTTTTILRRRLPTLILNVRSGAGTPKHTPPTPSGSVSDNEWELRTGRAIFLIQETLPLFFTTGLVTSVNRSTGAPRLPSSSSTSPFYIPPIPTSFLEFDPLDEGDASEDENVYSPTIHLSYTPPVQLPVPFPKTFHVEGLSLYLASSSFIRHTMNALYSDLAVSLDRVSVLTNPPPADGEPPRPQDSRRVRRDKSLRVRQLVTGVARVSGSPSEWEVCVCFLECVTSY